MPRKCIVCTSSAGLQCKQCQGVVYCSKICQRIDWNAGHHLACKPIGLNDTTDKRPLDSESDGKRQKHRLHLLRSKLLDVASELEDLIENPPQNRPEDFMQMLQEIQIKLQDAVQVGTAHVSATLVPEATYKDLLTVAANAARDLATRVDETDEFSIDDLRQLARDVDDVVRRVRAILLNPAIWLQRFDPDSYLSKVPEDIVMYAAKKQTPLEIIRPESSPWTMRLLDDSAQDRKPPIVSENTIYRIFEDYVLVIANGTSQAVPLPVGRVSGGYFSGLHGTLWLAGSGIASNFRYSGTWQLIQSVKIPASMRPIGVDMKNRLWLRPYNEGKLRLAVMRTDSISPTPHIVKWDIESELISPAITAIGLVAFIRDSQKLANYNVDDNNNHTVRHLDTLADALVLANNYPYRYSPRPVLIVGDRASTQISLLYARYSLGSNYKYALYIHDLLTNKTHVHKFVYEFGNFITIQPTHAAVSNDGRSILVWCAANKTGIGAWSDRAFRLST